MLFGHKKAEIQQLNCELTPDGRRLICDVLIVAGDEAYKDRVYAEIPKVKLKKTRKGVKIDYGD